jgi:hypothetical protein
MSRKGFACAIRKWISLKESILFHLTPINSNN